jgi:hypothetical protein
MVNYFFQASIALRFNSSWSLCGIQNMMSMVCATKRACIMAVVVMRALVQIVRKDQLANEKVTHYNILWK